MMVICDANKSLAKSIADYASYPPHWYRPAEGGVYPSNVPGLNVVMDESTSVTFCWMVHPNDSQVYRQIAMRRHVSSPNSKKGIPSPNVGLTLAAWFGFTGGVTNDDGEVRYPGPDWIIYDNGADRSEDKILIIAQIVLPAEMVPTSNEVPKTYLELHPWFSMSLEELRVAQGIR